MVSGWSEGSRPVFVNSFFGFQRTNNTHNARFCGTQLKKNAKILTCFNGIEMTKAEPDGLETQRRCLSAFVDN
jgi:hypothetical protein